MHDHKTSGGDEKVAHLWETYLVAGEDEDIQNDISGYDSFSERIIIIFGRSKIFYILALG